MKTTKTASTRNRRKNFSEQTLQKAKVLAADPSYYPNLGTRNFNAWQKILAPGDAGIGAASQAGQGQAPSPSAQPESGTKIGDVRYSGPVIANGTGRATAHETADPNTLRFRARRRLKGSDPESL